MATKYDVQIATLQSEADKYQTELDVSPTAIGGEQSPTSSDVSTQIRLQNVKNQLQRVRDQSIREKWYGPTGQQGDSTEGIRTGVMGKALDVIARPLYGIVGGVEALLGKGTRSDPFANMSENIKSGKRTFGDLLKGSNVPYPISAPLGLALDIAFDPINWATAGTAALVPRIGAGLIKGASRGGLRGAIEGAASGAGSSLLSKASFAGRIGSKIIPGGGSDVSQKYLSSLYKKSIISADEYNSLIGKNMDDIVRKGGIPIGGIIGSPYRATLGDMVKIAAQKIPGGESFLGAFNYSNKDWMRLARIKDTLEQSLGSGVEMQGAVRAALRGESIEPFVLAQEQKMLRAKPVDINWSDDIPDVPDAQIDKAMADLAASSPMFKKIKEGIEDADDIMNAPSKFISADGVENSLRLVEEATGSSISLDDINRIYHSGELDETGVRWYDNMISRVKDFKVTLKRSNNQDKIYNVGKATLDTYHSFINFFKVSKVAASPSAWMNAVVGNPTMFAMAGGDILDPKYFSRIKDGSRVAFGTKTSDSVLAELLDGGEMGGVMRNEPSAFTRTLGISPEYLSMRHLLERAVRSGKDAGLLAGDVNKNEIAKSLQEALDKINPIIASSRSPIEAAEVVSKITQEVAKPGRLPSSVSFAQDILKQRGTISAGDLPTSFAANEIFGASSASAKTLNWIRDEAAKPNASMGIKLINLLTNKALTGYDRIDQSYKIGTTLYLTKDGVTERELNAFRRLIDIQPEDIVSKTPEAGVYRYHLSGSKALELANEIYLNYNAMPAAVKVLRNIPLLGSPFASFMYGMALKTANTAVYNPSIFNKVTFALNDFGGQETPLEKEALKDKYYKRLNSPAMFRTPFFDENPVYVNLANMIPYYSFNMFNPSERKYADIYPNNFVNYIDKSPLLKDPVGSVIFDYFIQPAIIKNATPVGSFGQPLYPYGAGFGAKSLYAGRTLLESQVPGVLSYLGLATPEKYAEFAPSYRWRQLSYAKAGKGPYGVSGKEPASSRTLRGLAATVGIPVQAPVNLEYVKKKINSNK